MLVDLSLYKFVNGEMNKMDGDIIICRCEEITLKEIKNAIASGATTVDGVKRITRAGMGLCQGRTCRSLIENIISQELNKPKEELEYPSIRPPVRVMKIKAIAGVGREEN